MLYIIAMTLADLSISLLHCYSSTKFISWSIKSIVSKTVRCVCEIIQLSEVICVLVKLTEENR